MMMDGAPNLVVHRERHRWITGLATWFRAIQRDFERQVQDHELLYDQVDVKEDFFFQKIHLIRS